MLNLALFLLTILMHATTFAMLIWSPLFFFSGSRKPYVAFVFTLLAWIDVTLVVAVAAFYFQTLVSGNWTWWWFALLPVLSGGVLWLLVSRKYRSLWGLALYFLFVAGVIWFEEIILFVTSFGRDYLPSDWGSSGHYNFTAMLSWSLIVLMIACGIAGIDHFQKRADIS